MKDPQKKLTGSKSKGRGQEEKAAAHMPLEGIRILDWTMAQHGPVAAMMLGDLGADVIKVEGPGGDLGRGYMLHGMGKYKERGGRNFYFEACNRNKRSIVLDLKNEKAREIFYRLVEKSDVLIQNWRKGVAKKLGVDFQTLSKYNPRLIYASGTAFGPKGPESNKPGNDIMGLARSGVMLSMGNPEWPPVYPQGGFADQTGGIMLSWGILAALVTRERLGIAQEIHSSLLGTMISVQGLNLMSYLVLNKAYERRDRKNVVNPLWNYYRCADGKWIVLGLSRDLMYWHDFCEATCVEGLENDPRCDTTDKRRENNRELIAKLDSIFATKPRAEWLKMLGQNKDLLFTYMNDIPDLPDDPQVVQNDYIVDFDHPVWGKVKEVGFPVTFSETPASIRREAPMCGQHTEEVLMEILGYTWEDIAKLKDDGVI